MLQYEVLGPGAPTMATQFIGKSAHFSGPGPATRKAVPIGVQRDRRQLITAVCYQKVMFTACET